mgnify:FL=1
MSSSEVKTIKAISEARASFLIDNLDVSENIIYSIVNNIGKNENAIKRVRSKNERRNGYPLGGVFLSKYGSIKK